MNFLSEEQWVPYHRDVLARLLALASSPAGVPTHSAGVEYTSLMSCFLIQNIASAQALLSLLGAVGAEWFPVVPAFSIARTVFEVDLTAHYISRSPAERAGDYILFEHVLNKRTMDACARHRQSTDEDWRQAMEIEWDARWRDREGQVNAEFERVRQHFTIPGKYPKLYNNWSGKSLRKMAVEVGQVEAYDTFYAQLSSFSHGDIQMANRFVKLQPGGFSWSQRANWYDVGEVLHHTAVFAASFLGLYGEEFGAWDDTAVEECW